MRTRCPSRSVIPVLCSELTGNACLLAARLTVDPEKVRLEVWGSSCASVGEMRLHPSMVDPEGWTRLPSTPPEKVIEVTEKAIPGVEVMAHVWQWLQAIDP